MTSQATADRYMADLGAEEQDPSVACSSRFRFDGVDIFTPSRMLNPWSHLVLEMAD